MNERLFVIMEVVEDRVHNKNFVYKKKYYIPKNGKGSEVLYLNTSRIIPASRLRYGVPQRNEKAFYSKDGWGKACGYHMQQMLICDQEPEKQDGWLLG